MSIFAPSLPPAPPLTCTNNCVGFASDGFCDDGGPGSISAKCALGTDCHDCGDSWRHGTHLPQPSPGVIVDPEDAGPVPWWVAHSCGASTEHYEARPHTACKDGVPLATATMSCDDCAAHCTAAGGDPHGDRHRGVSIEQHRRESMEGREGRV